MTRLELMRTGTPEQIAEMMCENIQQAIDNCEICPATEWCRMGHTGYLDWLEQEADK